MVDLVEGLVCVLEDLVKEVGCVCAVEDLYLEVLVD